MAKNSETTIRVATPLLLTVGGWTFLIGSVIAASHSFSIGLHPLLNWTQGDAATACAGFGTVAAVFFALLQFVRQSNSERSRFALNMAMDGVTRSYNVLTATRPTTNAAWVNGARLILHAENVSRQMTEAEHRAAWNLFKEEWRIKFLDLISRPAEYFFGISESVGSGSHQLNYTDEVLEEYVKRAAIKPSITMTGYSGTSAGFNTMIHLRAIKTVFAFAEFPENFRDEDFLQRVPDFTPAEISKIEIQSRWGLFAYIKARQKWPNGVLDINRETDEEE